MGWPEALFYSVAAIAGAGAFVGFFYIIGR